MNKIKKVYLVFSIIFATVVVCYTLLNSGITVHATEYDGTQYGAENGSYGATENAPNASDEVVGDGGGFTLRFDGEDGNFSSTLRMLLVLTILTLSPSILIMLTSFTRCVIVLHFVRAAIGTNTAPPNQILIGLALFLTLFIMSPVLTTIKTEAIDPFDAGEITQEEAIDAAIAPVREFMYGQTQTKDLNLFCDIAGITYEKDHYDDVPFTIVVPAFILSELRTAFIIGFMIYIPFIVIDMVVASVLMSMGMMMLPPTTISLPFKILLFVLVDGWDLVIGGLVKTFY
jgi:flagellar biosynthetic protein FliP